MYLCLELFSALRGGGGGFAVVTEMKLKLHDVSLKYYHIFLSMNICLDALQFGRIADQG